MTLLDKRAPRTGQAPQSSRPAGRLEGHSTRKPQAPERGWLVVDGVKKTFKKRMVVKGVSVNLRRGESVGLLGPNGAGKTTVFYMITGLIKPDEGTVHIDGLDVTKLSMYRRARLGIGYLPQEASIFRGLSVEDNIMAVLEVTEPSKKERKRRLDELLEEFKIGRLRSFLLGSVTSSTAIILSSTDRPRKIEASCGR